MIRKGMRTAVLAASAGAVTAQGGGAVAPARGLQVNGKPLPEATEKCCAVGVGDELRSGVAPAVLTMKDGSRIVLGKNSQAKVEQGTVRLLAGSMEYQLSHESTLKVAVKEDQLAGRAGLASTTAAPPRPVAPAAAPKTVQKRK